MRKDQVVVHVSQYSHIHTDHVRVLLEQQTADGLVYYLIHNNCKPEDAALLDNGSYFLEC